jgi:hypothetical protein
MDKDDVTYWKQRCLIAEKKLETISSIPVNELNSIASIRQSEIDELKYHASKLLKFHDTNTNKNTDKWTKICKDAELSNDKIYYWKLIVQEGLILNNNNLIIN